MCKYELRTSSRLSKVIVSQTNIQIDGIERNYNAASQVLSTKISLLVTNTTFSHNVM